MSVRRWRSKPGKTIRSNPRTGLGGLECRPPAVLRIWASGRFKNRTTIRVAASLISPPRVAYVWSRDWERALQLKSRARACDANGR
jgi:hypothetical protein